MKIAQVWVEHPILKLDTPFSYLGDEQAEKGKRVLIDFNGRQQVGFIEEVVEYNGTKDQYRQENGFELKPLLRVLDEKPLFNDELFDLGKWLAYETLAPTIACFQAMLPAKIKPASNNQKIKMQRFVRIAKNVDPSELTERRKAAYEALALQKEMPLTTWRKEFSVGMALEKLGIVEQFEREAAFIEEKNVSLSKDLTLNVDQQYAFDEIKRAKEDEIILLHGVTGSGKTEVYLQLAKEIVQKQHKQVLILVPEISLTPQMVSRVKSRFGSSVAIYHSGLNNQEKYEQYQRVAMNQVDVVVGTRSAVFMPFSNLGLIVLDEEHDQSYKQDIIPQYHCRDVAIHRAKTFGCKVILGSATPSLESYSRAYKGLYKLIVMDKRINESKAKCSLVNVRDAIKRKENPLLSGILIGKIKERLSRQEQVILLLNRRGYTPIVRCEECGKTVQCPHCDVALSYHRSENLMKCHICGYQHSLIRKCECGSTHFQFGGYGTQRLEELVQKEFPDARILRMDADTTSRKGSHEKMLDQFGQGKFDILIGTQMIAKGLDFEKVTLVGILNADSLLQRTDYRSVELTFDLIAQAAGRSGRGSLSGEVIIQSYDTDHYAILCAASGDYMRFFKEEMHYRHVAQYPPYSYLISVLFSNRDQTRCQKECHDFKNRLSQNGYKVLGPGELLKTKDHYRYRLVLKGKDLEKMRKELWELLQKVKKERNSSEIRIDVNPMNLE